MYALKALYLLINTLIYVSQFPTTASFILRIKWHNEHETLKHSMSPPSTVSIHRSDIQKMHIWWMKCQLLTALLIFNSSSSYNLTSYLNQLSKSWCPNHSSNILHILVTCSLVSWSYQEPHTAYSHVSSVSFKYRLVFQPFLKVFPDTR